MEEEKIPVGPTNMLLQTVKHAKIDKSQKRLPAWHICLKKAIQRLNQGKSLY